MADLAGRRAQVATAIAIAVAFVATLAHRAALLPPRGQEGQRARARQAGRARGRIQARRGLDGRPPRVQGHRRARVTASGARRSSGKTPVRREPSSQAALFGLLFP